MKKGPEQSDGERDFVAVPLVRMKHIGDTELTPAVPPDAESLARLRVPSVRPEASDGSGSAKHLSLAHRDTEHDSEQRSVRGIARSMTPAGHQANGTYELAESLASGGMGSVHLAVQRGARGFARIVAIKRIHPHLMGNQKFCEMFIDEARIASRINHGSVCRIFDFGEGPEGYFIAMEYLIGEPLSRVLRALQDRSDVARASRYPLIVARIIAGVAEGLQAAHTLRDDQGEPLGVVHRDVSPQNLFVLYDGTVRVTDFGIAQARQRLHHTHGGLLKGKLGYMAPEQLDRKPIDGRADLWSLGVVFWEALTTRRLFRAGSEGETVMRVMSKVIPPPSTLNPHVPPALDAIVRRALTRDPNERYASARDLARDLERFLASAGDTVPTMDLAEWLGDVFPDGEERSSRRQKAALNPEKWGPSETTAPTFTDESIPPPSDSPPRGTESWEPTTQVRRREVTAEAGPTKPAVPGASRNALGSNRWRAVLLVCSLLVGSVIAWYVQRAHAAVDAPRPAVETSPRAPRPPAEAPTDSRAPTPNQVPSATPTPPIAAAAPSAHAVVAPASRSSVSSPARGNPARPVEAPRREKAVTPEAEPPPLETGTVLVNVAGGPADVYEGSTLLGRAPARATLKAGHHTITVRSLDGARQDVGVDVAAGALALLNLKFLAP